MTKQEEITHSIIEKILKDYPVILSMETHEDEYKAIVKLELGGFKRGKSTTFSYPIKGINGKGD
ncbi:hypothetical protein LCGC14_1144360 [marine sediment metagenome]|uniref:Uncharacterized protein n=1 Tax=marine sediment metagenome TaxID=412755 RepID=A0A0F9MKG6_9ZZZZ